MPRRSLTRDEQRDVAAQLHPVVLAELLQAGDWNCKNIAFQGGTSLHLIWNSPRFSEDLDFIVDRNAVGALEKSMKRVQKRVRDWFAVRYPDCKIELKTPKDPTKNNQMYEVVWSDPTFMEKVRVKVEFYAVDGELVRQYSASLQQISINSSTLTSYVSTVPAAQREWIYHDKIHAIATRGYLKWRDLFDVWWLRNLSRGTDHVGMLPPWLDEGFWHKATVVSKMYGETPEFMIDGLNEFLNRDDAAILTSAETDLKKFLPVALWKQLWPDSVKAMVELVKRDMTAVRDTLLKGAPTVTP